MNQNRASVSRPVQVEIIRSSRRTMALEVTRDGRVLVRAPYRMPETRIRAFVEEKKEWLEIQLARANERQEQQRQAGSISGEQRRAGVETARKRIPERAAYYAELEAGTCAAGGAGLCRRARALPPAADESFHCILE